MCAFSGSQAAKLAKDFRGQAQDPAKQGPDNETDSRPA